MFVIRQAIVDDHPVLYRLAKTVHFLNLPADLDTIRDKVVRSRKSFRGEAPNEREREFVFVLEDTESGAVVGTSSVQSCVSWPGHPEVALRLNRRELYSEDLQTGHVHMTLKLETDESGPSELGGLILAATYRGRGERLGSLLSLIRFHFIGLHPEWFSDRLTAQLMPPLTKDRHATLWDYLGRRFINLTYEEADRFSLTSKEFILSLFPRGEIFVTLLPPEARNIIGKVGPETAPARQMLENLGFEYKGLVDPFDGGPHLEADRGRIPLIASTRSVPLAGVSEDGSERGFVSAHGKSGFRAVRSAYSETGDGIALPAEVIEAIGAEPGDAIGLTPLPDPRHDTPHDDRSTAGASQVTP